MYFEIFRSFTFAKAARKSHFSVRMVRFSNKLTWFVIGGSGSTVTPLRVTTLRALKFFPGLKINGQARKRPIISTATQKLCWAHPIPSPIVDSNPDTHLHCAQRNHSIYLLKYRMKAWTLKKLFHLKKLLNQGAQSEAVPAKDCSKKQQSKLRHWNHRNSQSPHPLSAVQTTINRVICTINRFMFQIWSQTIILK